MSHPDQDPTPGIIAGAPASTTPLESAAQECDGGNLPLGLAAGGVAALIGAVLWAIITVVTEFQIGFMAVGIGFLVGAAVGKYGHGQTTTYRVLGAALALLGCVLGNFLTLVGFASRENGTGVFATLAQVDLTAVPGVMASTASPMDFLFYGIAIYEGYKLSVRN